MRRSSVCHSNGNNTNTWKDARDLRSSSVDPEKKPIIFSFLGLDQDQKHRTRQHDFIPPRYISKNIFFFMKHFFDPSRSRLFIKVSYSGCAPMYCECRLYSNGQWTKILLTHVIANWRKKKWQRCWWEGGKDFLCCKKRSKSSPLPPITLSLLLPPSAMKTTFSVHWSASRVSNLNKQSCLRCKNNWKMLKG